MGTFITGDGHTGTAPVAEPTQVRTDVERALYGETMAPEARTEMYSMEGGLIEAFRSRVEEVSDVLGLSREQLHTRHHALVGLAREAGLSPVVGDVIYQAATDAEIASARGASGDRDARVQAENEQVRRALREQYGDLAETWLALTQKYVRQHAKLQAYVDNHDLGSHPKVVAALVAHVRDIGYR